MCLRPFSSRFFFLSSLYVLAGLLRLCLRPCSSRFFLSPLYVLATFFMGLRPCSSLLFLSSLFVLAGFLRLCLRPCSSVSCYDTSLFICPAFFLLMSFSLCYYLCFPGFLLLSSPLCFGSLHVLAFDL